MKILNLLRLSEMTDSKALDTFWASCHKAGLRPAAVPGREEEAFLGSYTG